MIEPEKEGNDITMNSKTFLNALNYKRNLSQKTEMGKECMEETGINNKDRNRKQPENGPWEEFA